MRTIAVVLAAMLVACTDDTDKSALPAAPAADNVARVNDDDDDGREPSLRARAILAADAYQPGPPSGAFIAPDNGVTPPFPSQPIPGFSAILDAGNGTYLGMPDNGYGGKTLYPVIEGALRNDADVRRRVIHEFDIRRKVYSGRMWNYRVDVDFPDALISDFTALDSHRFILLERDGGQGIDARQKKVYMIDLRRLDSDGFVQKRLIVDLLRIRDPHGISLPARPGEFGVGDPFSFPLESVESLEALGGDRLLIANDNNYPNNDGRWIARNRPDDTELIIVRAPGLR